MLWIISYVLRNCLIYFGILEIWWMSIFFEVFILSLGEFLICCLMVNLRRFVRFMFFLRKRKRFGFVLCFSYVWFFCGVFYKCIWVEEGVVIIGEVVIVIIIGVIILIGVFYLVFWFMILILWFCRWQCNWICCGIIMFFLYFFMFSRIWWCICIFSSKKVLDNGIFMFSNSRLLLCCSSKLLVNSYGYLWLQCWDSSLMIVLG